MIGKLKCVAKLLLMALATVGAICIVFVLIVAMCYGMVIATQTHPAICVVGGLVSFVIALTVAYYNKKFK